MQPVNLVIYKLGQKCGQFVLLVAPLTSSSAVASERLRDASCGNRIRQ